MQFLTNLIFLLVAVASMFKNQQCALLYRYFQQSLKSYIPPAYFLPPCWIQNLCAPHCSMLWSLPKMNVSLFMLWATLLSEASSMLSGVQSMKTRSRLLFGIILNISLRRDSIHTAELSTQAGLALYLLFVIKFLAIHPTLRPAQWGNTCWQKLTSQSWTNWPSQKSLNWPLRMLMKQLWPSSRGRQDEESQ